METTCCDITDWSTTCLKDSTHREFSALCESGFTLKPNKIILKLQYKLLATKQILTFLWSIYISVILCYIYSIWLTGKQKRLEFLYLNQNGRLVQLVAQQGRNIGFVHVLTPANTKAIQIAACVVGWVRSEQKYYGACKLLTEAGDNMQPENCETDSKPTKIHRVGLWLPVVMWRSPVLAV